MPYNEERRPAAPCMDVYARKSLVSNGSEDMYVCRRCRETQPAQPNCLRGRRFAYK